MSTSPSSLPERNLDGPSPPRSRLISFSAVEAPSGRKMPDIRRQAIAGIEALMSLSHPEGEREREQLRAYVEAHPGQPEVALAKHLLAFRSYITNLSAGAGPDPQGSNGDAIPRTSGA